MTRIVWLLAGLLLVLSGRATAQTSPTYVQFDPFTVKGALYRPADSPRDVALLLIHRVNNYLGHRAAVELSNRGFLVLTMNSRLRRSIPRWIRSIPPTDSTRTSPLAIRASSRRSTLPPSPRA